MTDIGFRYFDTDNHYYEAADAFTRHVDPSMRDRCMDWAEVNGKRRLMVAGKVNRFIPNPHWDPVARPGSMDAYFRGEKPATADIRETFGELDRLAERPEYQDRDARLEVMDAQGMHGAFLLPTLGVGMEQALLHDPEAAITALRGFNRWVNEDWGFAYQERIFAAPIISLLDPQAAEEELDFALANDARGFIITTGPIVHPERGGISLAAPELERFWSKVNESGIALLLHSGDTYYTKLLDLWGEDSEMQAFKMTPFRAVMSANPIHDTVASLLSSGMFLKYPNLRAASIESGSNWVHTLLAQLKKSYLMNPLSWGEDPRETLRRHVWVSPYYEENLGALKEAIGIDRIIMGSDWPHAEGLADPATYLQDLKANDYSDDECRQVMRDNGLALTRRAV